MLSETDLLNLIKLGEGLNLEFKASAAHLGREICGMANGSGGRILIGVDDQGRVVGVSHANRLKSEIQNIARTMDPPLALDIHLVESVLVVTVPSGPNRPYSANGLFYLREAANTQRMKRDELREFFFKEGLIRFDEQVCRKFDKDRDLDPRKYRAFARLSAIPKGMSRDDVLSNLHVLAAEGMTNVGSLLFAKDVGRFHLQASVICALFQGHTTTKILDKEVHRNGVLMDYENAITYLTSHLNTEYVIKGGPREEILELPEDALREAVLNAIAHRDYRSTACVQIHIFLDRVEISNPGGLVPGLTLQQLGRVSRPRNALLFALMEKMELVENVGSGIKRMRDAMRMYGLESPLIEADESWFRITFRRKPQHESLAGDTHKPTPKTTQKPTQKAIRKPRRQKSVREKILREFARNPSLTREEMAMALGRSPNTIKEYLAKLKKEGRLMRKGPVRGGIWVVVAHPGNKAVV